MSRTRTDALLPRLLGGLLVACGTLAVTAVGCGQDAALVGGHCAAGYTQCSLSCVDLQNDPNNCGACGHACPSGVACVAGTCGGTLDGSPGSPDGSPDASPLDAPFDAVQSDAPSDGGDAPVGDAIVGDAVTGDVVTVDACVPPYETVDQCGTCFTVCSGVNDACKENDGVFACAPLCDPPLSECSGTCVDETNDPNNCGACGHVCASTLCVASHCEGATAGNDIVIGHDYATTGANTSQARALSNAVFLPSANPLRILSFEHYADPNSVARVKAILNAAAVAASRMLAFTVSTTDTDIPFKLTATAFDVLLVYDQANATAGTLGPLGTSWMSTLSTYLMAGGNVVTLDGAAGTTGEMPLFETHSGLLAVTSHTSMTVGTPLTVLAPGDSVAVGVLSPYGAGKSSAHFATTAVNGGNIVYVVVEPVSGQPVIVHKVIP